MLEDIPNVHNFKMQTLGGNAPIGGYKSFMKTLNKWNDFSYAKLTMKGRYHNFMEKSPEYRQKLLKKYGKVAIIALLATASGILLYKLIDAYRKKDKKG
jgi:hypothetical protein